MAEDTIKAPAVDVVPDSKKLSPAQIKIAKEIHDEALAQDVDPEFALAIAWQENRFKPLGKSSAGAVGPMQIMPSTAKGYGISSKELVDPSTNIRLGVQIIKDRLDANEGDKLNTLIDYNAGPSVTKMFNKAKRDLNVLPEETKDYISNIHMHHPIEAKGVDFNVISPAQAEEKNPFDYEIGGEGKEKGFESIFGPTEELPAHLNEVVPAGTEKPFADRAAAYMLDNPQVPTAGIAGAYAQSKMNDAMQKNAFEEGLRRAQMPPAPPVGQPPAPPMGQPQMGQLNIEEQPMTSGDKWSAKVTGGMGPGGGGVTEAARNYRIQQRLNTAPDVQNPQWQVNREGMILPRGQQEKIDAAEAQRLIDEAERAKSPLQRAREYTQMQIEKPAPTMLGKMARIGRLPVIGPLATGSMASYSAAKFQEAEEKDQQGDALGAALARFNGTFAGAGAVPASPWPALDVVKGTGMAGSAAMTGIEAIKDLLFPYQSVTKTVPPQKKATPPQLKKADGGYIPLSLKDVYFHRNS